MPQCPDPNCQNIIADLTPETEHKPMFCPECGHNFCPYCHGEVVEGTCISCSSEFQTSDDDEEKLNPVIVLTESDSFFESLKERSSEISSFMTIEPDH